MLFLYLTPIIKNMKKTIYLFLFVVLTVNNLSLAQYADAKVEAKSEITSKSVADIMNFLASDELMGRDSGTEGLEMAANYIEKIFKEYGVKPYFASYKDTLTNFDKTTYNIVGVVPGNDEVLKHEYIIIGAHYDHIGKGKPVDGDDIANGANDNASGTTAVVELAKYFAKNKTNQRSLMFVLFAAEEKGLLGSKHLAEKLKEHELNLYAMVNFEMIGVPMNHDNYLLYVTGYNKSNMAQKFNEYANNPKLIGFLPTAQEYMLFQRSDNYPFHKVFNVPSQTLCTFDFTNFKHYHGVDDEVSEMDFSHMAHVINSLIPVLEKMAETPAKEIQYYK